MVLLLEKRNRLACSYMVLLKIQPRSGGPINGVDQRRLKLHRLVIGIGHRKNNIAFPHRANSARP